jgi:hypothetical protein
VRGVHLFTRARERECLKRLRGGAHEGRQASVAGGGDYRTFADGDSVDAMA